MSRAIRDGDGNGLTFGGEQIPVWAAPFRYQIRYHIDDWQKGSRLNVMPVVCLWFRD